jgi:rare lipoprotein A
MLSTILAVFPAIAIFVAPLKHEAVASWYGRGFHGRLTASGRIYDQDSFTAAHRSCRFGTVLLVRHEYRHVIVTVTDRGPFVPGRDIDLSRASFMMLADTTVGILEIEYEVIYVGNWRYDCGQR